jgi:5-(aminomethyl)-3-furanmethanol phosphate kinase
VTSPSSNADRSPLATVVKLGGSLSESRRLAAILPVVAGARAPVVVVPGGGTFADAVRVAQADLGFNDAIAHRMAILAMHQTAHMLAGLEPRLVPVETLAAIRRTLADGGIPVWLPWKLCARDKSIPADWSITSDGLAARLAERLGGAPVVLVKSCAGACDATLDRLARAGTVDPTFVTIVERARLSWRVLGAGEEAELAAIVKAQRQARRRSAAQRAIARSK